MRLLICLISSYLISFSSFAMFTSPECITNEFQAEVMRKGSLFGLLKYKFEIKKTRCLIEIFHKDYLEKSWNIDICRAPIHMKVEQFRNLTVLKREGSCNRLQSDYCNGITSLIKLIEDEGLIFASGEREILASNHGKVYCSYLLLKKYLEKGEIFSLEDYLNVNLFGFNFKKMIEGNKMEPVPEVNTGIQKVAPEKLLEKKIEEF